mmetsp:Transcript_29237/g.66239  ORF Transcript_29237/g.66239 Transcript_29237/m.66239 type:complete len:221 (-) Transcript_29237:433-1095(-)
MPEGGGNTDRKILEAIALVRNPRLQLLTRHCFPHQRLHLGSCRLDLSQSWLQGCRRPRAGFFVDRQPGRRADSLNSVRSCSAPQWTTEHSDRDDSWASGDGRVLRSQGSFCLHPRWHATYGHSSRHHHHLGCWQLHDQPAPCYKPGHPVHATAVCTHPPRDPDGEQRNHGKIRQLTSGACLRLDHLFVHCGPQLQTRHRLYRKQVKFLCHCRLLWCWEEC